MSRLWTPDEDAIVLRMYNRYPQASVAASIHRHTGSHRTPEAIRNRANKIGAHGDRIPRGHTRLVDAHDKNHGRHTGASVTIIRAAKAAGVLKQAHHVRGQPNIAPTTWVEAWLEEHYRIDLPAIEQADTDVLDWIPTREFARRLGIDKQHAANQLIHQRGRLRKLAQHARRVRLMHRPGRPLVWHPDDVSEIVRAYRPEQLRRAA